MRRGGRDEQEVRPDVVKTLFERQPDLVLAHRESANMTLENQTIGASRAVASWCAALLQGERHHAALAPRGRLPL